MTKSIAIIGGGIVGSSAAYFLSQSHQFDITLFDEPTGQASRAAAGIISPWLSQRRNKKWYRLAKEGAALYPQLMKSIQADDETYQQVGTLLFKKDEKLLTKLYHIAEERKITAPEIGDIQLLTPEQIQSKCPPFQTDLPGLFVSGGARVDGEKLIKQLHTAAIQNGVIYKEEKVALQQLNEKQVTIQKKNQLQNFDLLILAVGPHLPQMLAPFGFEIDVRPQKGQLLVLNTPTDWATESWPVIMPQGEVDLIPTHHHQMILGATHENDAGFDLTINEELTNFLIQQAIPHIPSLADAEINQIKVGTRAYTSDFLPFFGPLPTLRNICIASGLGASGLTTGPLIGRLLVDYITKQPVQFENYQQPIENYVRNI